MCLGKCSYICALKTDFFIKQCVQWKLFDLSVLLLPTLNQNLTLKFCILFYKHITKFVNYKPYGEAWKYRSYFNHVKETNCSKLNFKIYT